MCGSYTGEFDMNGFDKMKVALEHQGWYVGWAEGYFQDEGWCNVPYQFPSNHPHAGKEVDADKCLFNIIQDVELEDEYILGLDDKLEAGKIDEETYEDLCEEHYEDENYREPYETPEQASGSCFCFGNAETLKEIIPIIEECGCDVNWNGSIKTRPYISWRNNTNTDWPDEERIDIIGQNGNNGEHYK